MKSGEDVIAFRGVSLVHRVLRMAGMTNLIAWTTGTYAVHVAPSGTVPSLPLIMAMVLVFRHMELLAALGFCVLTDFGAASSCGR